MPDSHATRPAHLHADVMKQVRGDLELGDEVVIAVVHPHTPVALIAIAVCAFARVGNLDVTDGHKSHAICGDGGVCIEDAHITDPAVLQLRGQCRERRYVGAADCCSRERATHTSWCPQHAQQMANSQ